MRTPGANYLFRVVYANASIRIEAYARCWRAMQRRWYYAFDVSPQVAAFPLYLAQKEGIDDALIQPYSGHATRRSLEIYSKLSLADAQPSYNQAMERFPIQ